ncbi:MAG: hypothetical protein ABL901_00375 [Hyphomicrobiaceae bacterium]
MLGTTADKITRIAVSLQTYMPHAQCSPRPLNRLTIPLALLVVTVGAIVQPAGGLTPSAFAAPAKVPTTNATLPNPVAEMRDAILVAVHSGKLTDLKTALELNEMRPDIADTPVDDPVAYFASQSKDGKGTDILAALSKILALNPAAVPLGRDIENNAIYVWPYLAERDLTKLTAQEEADLAALVPAEEAIQIKKAKRWVWWRLSIGADGTWHSFRREK